MVYFTEVRPTAHYLEEHSREVPFPLALAIIAGTKNPRKKGTIFEIDRNGYYIVFEIRGTVLYLINAKKR